MIELTGVRYRYRPDAELAFPDIGVPRGGTLVLRGASGSGKSTLLALLAGLLTPTAGQVRVEGIDVGALPPRERDAWRGRTLGFLPQRLHLSDSLDAASNIALALWAGGEPVDAQRVAAVMERLGIAELLRRRPHELSIGQAQRVALARAIVRKPALLLADEPTASLDDGAAAAVLGALQEAAQDTGATLVIATHDERVLRTLGPRLQEARLP